MSLIKSRPKQGFHWSSINQELKSITTIDFTCKALNIVEKLLWISLATIGILWAAHFLPLIVKDENPIVKTIMDKPLTLTEKPAITICPQGSTKFAIVERLGNFLSTKEEMPENIIEWQNMLAMCVSIFSKQDVYYSFELFEKSCIKVTPMNEGCKVTNQNRSYACETHKA